MLSYSLFALNPSHPLETPAAGYSNVTYAVEQMEQRSSIRPYEGHNPAGFLQFYFCISNFESLVQAGVA